MSETEGTESPTLDDLQRKKDRLEKQLLKKRIQELEAELENWQSVPSSPGGSPEPVQGKMRKAPQASKTGAPSHIHEFKSEEKAIKFARAEDRRDPYRFQGGR